MVHYHRPTYHPLPAKITTKNKGHTKKSIFLDNSLKTNFWKVAWRMDQKRKRENLNWTEEAAGLGRTTRDRAADRNVESHDVLGKLFKKIKK